MKSRKLSPKLKAITDPIYNANPGRFKLLYVWVRKSQRQGYSDSAIALTLQMATLHVKTKSYWWAYLTSLLEKGHHKAFEEEHERLKTAERDYHHKPVQGGLFGRLEGNLKVK